MFCYKCGFQIPDDAQFCSKCGTEQKANISQIDQASSDDHELNREALKIYLENVLSLECCKKHLEEKIESLNCEIATIKDNNFMKQYDILNGNNGIWLYFNGNEYYIAYSNYANGSVITNKFFNFRAGDWYWLPIEKNLKHLSSSSAYISITGGIYSFFENSSRKACARDNFLKAYNEFKSEALTSYQSNVKLVDGKSLELSETANELTEVERLLSQAYSINIIPSSFRYKIHAIYYLHDFIVSSKQSFTTALLHCDLDEIKEKLDEIIEQQQEIIINQALMMAQNEKIMKQNEQQLRHLASIEQNTDRAAQYAQIASNNAEACAWIGIANYISK